MTLLAHFVADDVAGGVWQPRDGNLGAYIVPTIALAQTQFPRSRTRFRNMAILPNTLDILANIGTKTLCPVIGGGWTFETVLFLTKNHTEIIFGVGPNGVSGDGLIIDFTSLQSDVTLSAGAASVESFDAAAWTNASVFHYITLTLDLSVAGKQTFTLYDSATQVSQRTFSNAALAAAMATWTPLSQASNVEIEMSNPSGPSTENGLIEWAIHDRVISAAEVNFRTTYFRVLNQ